MNKILKIIVIYVVVFNIVSAENPAKPKKYFSVGFLDHKTGMSLVSYAKTLFQNDNHDIFLGGGTAIALFTGSLGWKYTFYSGNVQTYSVIALHAVSGMGGGFYAPFFSIGIEKELTKNIFINGGVNSIVRTHPDKPIDAIILPTLNINFRY